MATEVNRKCDTYIHMRKEWLKRKWNEIKLGTLVKIEKDTEFPADMFLLKSSRDNGIAYVDTMNLDGETNMKEKLAMPQIQELSDNNVINFDGEIICDIPNENLEKWDANISSLQLPETITVGVK